MAKKINPLWIIGGIVLVIMIGTKGDLGTQATNPFEDNPTSCEHNLEVRQSQGYDICTECFQLTPTVINCMQTTCNHPGTAWANYPNNWAYIFDLGGCDTIASVEKCAISQCINQQSCNTPADTNCDNSVSNPELLSYLSNWVDNQVSNPDLLTALSAWVNS